MQPPSPALSSASPWAEGDENSVRVAVRVRPLLPREKLEQATSCVTSLSDKQIILGSDRAFTFDRAYGDSAQQDSIYTECVLPLVDSFFKGYNATVFAYGQTGSGKTHTMGTVGVSGTVEEDQGIIPRALADIFHEVSTRSATADVSVRVSFLEIYNENIRDLLDHSPAASSKSISIRDDAAGNVKVLGASEISVESCSDMVDCLEKGALCRSTGHTSMNDVSSRSHAIFTVHVDQRMRVQQPAAASDPADAAAQAPEELVSSKFHFVDLAGSERAKRTQASGARLKEGININFGLLVLGNVISALGDVRRKATHVPYRDSKLTRILQDSLGGNSRTLMIACISPSDSSFEETMNALKYANRARNIRNRAVVNRDPYNAQLQQLKQQLAAVTTELAAYIAGATPAAAAAAAAATLAGGAHHHGDGSGGKDVDQETLKEMRELRGRVTVLTATKQELLQRLGTSERSLQLKLEELCQVSQQRDIALFKYEAATGTPLTLNDTGCNSGAESVVAGQSARIHHLTQELVKERQATATLKAKMAEQQRMLCKDLQVLSERNREIKALEKEKHSLAKRISGADAFASPRPHTACSSHPSTPARATPRAAGEHAAKQLASPAAGVEANMDALNELPVSATENASGCAASPGLGMIEEAGGVCGEEGFEEREVAEEEKRRRLELKAIDNEVRDVAQTIDAKEALHAQLLMTQQQYEDMREAYEVKLKELAQGVLEAQASADAAKTQLNAAESKEKSGSVATQDAAAALKAAFEQRVRELNEQIEKQKRHEAEYARWQKVKARDEGRLKELAVELDVLKKTKTGLQRRLQQESSQYKEWKASHNTELAKVRRQAKQAEMKILKLEGENAAQRAVLRRREEEKAAVQRRTRDVALLSAAAAKERPVSKERVDTKALAQKVDRFRLRRWKMLLERELELHSRRHEQGQCIGRDEVALKKLNKTLVELCAQRDQLQLRLNRTASDAEEGEGEGAERLQEVEDAIDAADAQAEYLQQKIAGAKAALPEVVEMNKQSCDDSEETLLPNVDELFNTEAKPLLGFLFKKVVLLQQAKQQMASVIAALELQEETQRQQQVQAAAAARKAELHYERRVAAVEREGEEKMMLMCRAAGIDDAKVDAAAAASHDECLRLLRLRGEELRIMRKQVEALEHEVQQAAAAAATAVPTAAALAEAITQIDLPRQAAAPPAAAAKAAAAPAKARSVFERLADESNFTGATREKILMKRVRIKFIGRWMSRWRQALPALRAERVASLAASKATKQAQIITVAKAGGVFELRAQAQPSSPSVKKHDATNVLSPQQHQPQVAAAALVPVSAPQQLQADEPTKGGENVTPNVARNIIDDAEKKVQQQQQPMQQQQQPTQQQENITLRRSSRAKRSSPVLSSVDSGGSGSGGSESDSHTPRTSDAGIGKTDTPASVHVQGHSGAANAVAWTSAKDFISVGSDGVARVWDASGAKLSAKCSFQGKGKVGLRAVATVSEHVFATGGGDAGISMWDMRMKKAVAVLQGHVNEVSALVNCSGDVLASASADGTLRVWDTRTGMTAAEMRGHAGRVNALAVDRQSFTLYSGGRDKTVHEWRGTAWQSGLGDGLTFAGNVLPPSCGDVVLALAACSSSSSTTVVAGSKNGCIQTWRGGRSDGSTSIARGQINALQLVDGGGTHVLVGCADGCVVKVQIDSSHISHVCDSSSQAPVTAIAGSCGSYVVADAEGGLQLLRLQCE